MCLDQTMLTSSCVEAPLSFSISQVRRTSLVRNRVRRLTHHAYEPQGRARRTYEKMHKAADLQQRCTTCKGHVSGASCSTDSIQQQQKQQPREGGPNISLLSEELQKQWHEELNMHLGNIIIRPGSKRKVWWSCDQCPDGLPHIWEATIRNRTHGTGCPFCSGRAICQHNTLARWAPAAALLWDAKKNHPLSAAQVTVCSRMRAHWKCNVCLYEWQAPVEAKVRINSAWPQCARAHAGREADGTRQKHPTFAAAQHALLDQWDHDRNKEIGIFPNDTTLRSGKLFWWRCRRCPKGKVHSWQACAYAPTSSKQATGCPCCAGHKVCEGNSLQTVYDIAVDFDADKNGVSAAQVTSSASKPKYSWLSDEPGAQKRSVNQRTFHTRRKVSQLLDVHDS